MKFLCFTNYEHVNPKSFFLSSLQIPCEEEDVDDDSGNKSLIITAYSNTWSQKGKVKDGADKITALSSDEEADVTVEQCEQILEVGKAQNPDGDTSSFLDNDDSKGSNNHQLTNPDGESCKNVSSSLKRKLSDTQPCSTLLNEPEHSEPATKRVAVETLPITEQSCHDSTVLEDKSSSDESESDYLIKARLLIRLFKDKLRVEMHWLNGNGKAGMHGLFDFMRTYLKYT